LKDSIFDISGGKAKVEWPLWAGGRYAELAFLHGCYLPRPRSTHSLFREQAWKTRPFIIVWAARWGGHFYAGLMTIPGSLSSTDEYSYDISNHLTEVDFRRLQSTSS